jgi:hypothetical protein
MTLLSVSAPTWFLAALLVLLLVVLCGPDRIHRRMLELIRVLRGGGSSQSDTTPPPRDAGPPS